MQSRIYLFLTALMALAAIFALRSYREFDARTAVAQADDSEKQAEITEPPIYYEDVKPLLDRQCVGCHAWAKTSAGLLEKKSDFSGTKGLRIVYPARPDSSVLIWRLEGRLPSGKTVGVMPRGRKKLEVESIRKFSVWIAQGAKERPSEKNK